TGLVNAHDAILAIDAGAKDSWLFLGKPSPAVLYRPELRGFDAIYVEPGAESERALGIEHVVPWDQFISFVESRRAKSLKLPMYVESGGFTGGLIGRSSNPPEMAPVENLYVLWQRAVQERWPDAEIRDATPVVEELRAVKSDGEIALLRAAAEQTAAAFWAGAAAIRPGRTTREVEAEVVRTCVQKGAQGPSFWPWVRAGVSAGPTAMFQAMADYRNSSSAMAAGELVPARRRMRAPLVQRRLRPDDPGERKIHAGAERNARFLEPGVSRRRRCHAAG
ncbi:MAG TPA: M24 family metallopeptidase, partial [Thermoanaerobaculia bacterium]